MNLEQTQTTFNPPAAISASGANYDWNISGRKTTASEHIANGASATKKVATSKPAIVAYIVITSVALVFTAFTVVSDMREKAYQAKIQRESRVVVL